MANNKDFIVKNAVEVGGPTKVTVGDAATGGSYTAGYDLSAAAYDSVSFSVSTQEAGPSSVFFKDDGTKMYIIGYNGDEINEYSLSTAWDITTASASSVLSVSSYETLPRGLVFKTDGTSLYFTGLGNDQVRQYDMTTAWDISTASYSKTFSVSSQETSPSGLFFKSDGTKMYVSGQSGVDINEYTLSTAWDVSTASYSQNFSISSEFASNSPQALFFKSDGTKVFVVGRDETHVVSYTLSTAWDISTASYDGTSFSVATQDGSPYGVFLKSDGLKMYIAGDSTNTIYQYTTGSAVTTGSFDLSTGNYFTDTPSVDVEYTFSNAGDVQSFQLEVTGTQVINGFDLSVAAYDSKTVNLSTTAQDQSGIFFKPDGTVFYALSFKNNDTVYQYSVSTAWDISTVNTTATNSYDVSAQDSQSKGLFFKPDGTKMYVVGATTNYRVYEYELSTAWDLSTVSYNSNFYTTSMTNAPIDLYFKPDGTKMYTTESNYVYEYDLSTAWDVTTASFVNKSSAFSTLGGATNAQGFFLKDDGTELYQAAGSTGVIYVYALTTAWDTSTIQTSTLNFSAASQTTAPGALFFGDGGTKMYTNEINGGAVYQYSTSTSTAITVTWDADIAWPSGTAPDSPAAGEKDIYTFTTDDGGTTYIGVQSGDAFS